MLLHSLQNSSVVDLTCVWIPIRYMCKYLLFILRKHCTQSIYVRMFVVVVQYKCKTTFKQEVRETFCIRLDMRWCFGWIKFWIYTLLWNDHHHCRHHPVSRNVELNLLYRSIYVRTYERTSQAVHSSRQHFENEIILFDFHTHVARFVKNFLVWWANCGFSKKRRRF